MHRCGPPGRRLLHAGELPAAGSAGGSTSLVLIRAAMDGQFYIQTRPNVSHHKSAAAPRCLPAAAAGRAREEGVAPVNRHADDYKERPKAAL